MADCTQQFVNYLVDQTPHFDKDVIRDLNPQSGTWIGKAETRTWPSFMGNSHSFDRFTNVFANPIREFTDKEYLECEGTPCDYDCDEICWGNVRQNYAKETRCITTQLLCFDQIRDVSHAQEHAAQIVSNILRPSADNIMSYYMKKRAAMHAGEKWVANTTMPAFTFTFTNGAGADASNEIYMDCSVDPDTIYKLAPQMLQRRVMPLTLKGYMQNKVFDGFPNLIELITDVETTWDLDKQVNSAVGANALAAFWRFQDWANGNGYWKYGFSGQLGNYTVSVDPFALRFNYRGELGVAPNTYRYDVILPYVNTAAGTAVYEGASFEGGSGLRMIPNTHYDIAQYQFSYLHHRKAGIVYVADAQQINPNMPFGSRNLAGEWKFANTELGCENIRKNKGKFYADFELAWKPEHPEWEELILHRREPACVPEIEACNTEPTYYTEDYNSACDECDEGPWDADLEDCEQDEGLQVTAITVSGIPVELGTVQGVCYASLELLIAGLNADAGLSLMGTWDGYDSDGDDTEDSVVLTNPTVHNVSVTIACCENPGEV